MSLLFPVSQKFANYKKDRLWSEQNLGGVIGSLILMDLEIQTKVLCYSIIDFKITIKIMSYWLYDL